MIKYPYTDFHEMNLDWFITTFRELLEQWEDQKQEFSDLKEAWRQLKTWVTEYFDNLDVQQEINNKIDDMYADGSLASILEGIFGDFQSTVGTRIDVLESRVDEITNLPEGSTAGDAELADIRIGAYGETYPTAGDAVRGQIDYVNNSLMHPLEFRTTSQTANGVTVSYSGGDYILNGTCTATHIYNLITKTPLKFINPGDRLNIQYEASKTAGAALGFIWYDVNDTPTYSYITGVGNQFITVPDTAVNMQVRIMINQGFTFNNDFFHAEITPVSQMDEYNIRRAYYYLNNEPFYNILNGLTWTNRRNIEGGINFIRDDLGNFKFVGTPTAANVSLNIWYNKTAFTLDMEPGKKYRIIVNTPVAYFRVISYTGPNDNGTALFSGVGSPAVGNFTIPDDATGVTLRFQFYGLTVGTPIDTSARVLLYEDDPISGAITTPGCINKTAKMWALGNSFMQGAVWVNDTFDHVVSYDDSIYGIIANKLNIPSYNVTPQIISSTGFMYDAGSGCFKDIIKNAAISNYDYILTQFNGSDINVYDLGSVNSAANDGTLAGGIVDVMNYIRTYNGKCQLVILGTPPYSADPAHSGNTVFSGNWNKGYSINDLDNVMYALAKKYHFTYISWQDLAMSYHYMDYADYTPGQTGPRHASSDAVYRDFGLYAANQLSAVSNPIALSKIV